MNPALLTLRTFVWNLTFRRPISLLLFFIALLCMWVVFSRLHQDDIVPSDPGEIDWEAEYEKLRLAGLKENMAFYVADRKNLKPVPMQWTERDHCPACFGVDMCEAIKQGEILIEIPESETSTSKKGVYLGKWRDVPIAVKRLSNWYPTEFESFDKFICKDSLGSESCNVSEIIVTEKSFAQQLTTFDPEHMLNLWKISYPKASPLSLAYTMCVTPHVVKMFSDMYANKPGGNLSPEGRAMLFTSMVVQPESIMLKFLKGIQFQRLAPRAYGACGRLIVVEHGGHLLPNYLNRTFSERAELAMQLMSLVQVLWHADRRWFALYRDFDFENFAVSHENEIYIIDYEELSIIENVDFDEVRDEDRHEEHNFGRNITCNADCFNGLLKTLSSETLSFAQRRTHCQSLHSVTGSLMYSELCRNILSDLKEHRTGTDQSTAKYRGLLHSVPSVAADALDMTQKVESLLRECVHETGPGRRVQAINDLSDVLAVYLKIA